MSASQLPTKGENAMREDSVRYLLNATEDEGLHGESIGADSILESISDGVFTIDMAGRIRYLNRAVEMITGISRQEAVGKVCSQVFRSSLCEGNCALRQTMATGVPVINRPAYICNAAGEQIPISVSAALLRNSKHEVVGAAETFRDLRLVDELVREPEGRCQIGDLVTKSVLMRKILDILPQVAASDSTVLIQGETGTGKELLARAIHTLSSRSAKPMVALNCCALPDTLLESELFGYKNGAFTGANKDKIGRFALAEGGILFLDEIGEISPALQVKLLRVLQERSYEPLGGVHPVATDVRIVAAANKSLSALVEEGSFRQDLYYRINVVCIDLPPLRRRKEDIPLLVDHFIARFNRRQRKAVQGVSQETMGLLMAHDFPGNCRELENIIEHAFVLCSSGYITPDTLPHELAGERGERQAAHPNGSFGVVAPRERGDMEGAVHAVESQAILAALKRNNYNRVAAARELGIHKSTLFRKMKHLDIPLPLVDGRCRQPPSSAWAEKG
ncbi:MAG: sigma-54 interaction domain-containing protein [Thermodesulfobacteriota bacterium]